jgi:Abortive infection alpha
MDEETLKSTAKAAEEVGGLANKVYSEMVSPVAKPVMATVGAGVDAMLTPMRVRFEMYSKQREADLYAAAAAKLKSRGVPDEQLIEPAPHVYGTILMGATLASPAEDLADMFAGLLASAVDSQAAGSVHPAFAEMLRQMSPADAKLFRMLHPARPIAMDVSQTTRRDAGEIGATAMRTARYPKGSPADTLDPSCLSLINLERLGLVDSDAGIPKLPPTRTPERPAQATVVTSMNVAGGGWLRLTPLGVALWRACGCEFHAEER